jgi:hypothetical protein
LEVDDLVLHTLFALTAGHLFEIGVFETFSAEPHPAFAVLPQALGRLGFPADTLCDVVDALETQDFRGVAQLPKCHVSGAAFRAEPPEFLFEGESKFDDLGRYARCVWVGLQRLDFFWCKGLFLYS